MSSCFRIYYSRDSKPLTEQIEATALDEAVRLAESRRAQSSSLRYFEIWQDSNLLFTSQDHPNSRTATTIPRFCANDDVGRAESRAP